MKALSPCTCKLQVWGERARFHGTTQLRQRLATPDLNEFREQFSNSVVNGHSRFFLLVPAALRQSFRRKLEGERSNWIYTQLPA